MKFHAAILFFPDSLTQTEGKTPLYLQPVWFCPALTWMLEELKAREIKRIFIVSAKNAQEAMKEVVPGDCSISWIDGADHGRLLGEGLQGINGDIMVLNGVALPVGVFSGGAVYRASADACRVVLQKNGTFSAIPEKAEIMGGWLPVGDEEELRAAQAMCRQKILEKHFAAGVTVIDSGNTYLDPRVVIGKGTVLMPGTILRGSTVIGENCTVGPNAMVTNCTIGNGTTVNASQLNDSTVGSNTTVGPFAYVRPNCHIGDHARIGDFVELKNSIIGNGTKVSHLTYVGDSDVGERVNFGCGTVTSNYDGHKKFRCTIGDDSFIGCNTNLVAPVAVGKGSYIAAGSTITKPIPEDALAIARTEQKNKDGWAAKRRALWKSEK